MKFTIKQARLINGITQRKMAEFLDVHIDTYRKIENDPDSATVKQAKIISTVTGLCVEDIFFID